MALIAWAIKPCVQLLTVRLATVVSGVARQQVKSVVRWHSGILIAQAYALPQQLWLPGNDKHLSAGLHLFGYWRRRRSSEEDRDLTAARSRLASCPQQHTSTNRLRSTPKMIMGKEIHVNLRGKMDRRVHCSTLVIALVEHTTHNNYDTLAMAACLSCYSWASTGGVLNKYRKWLFPPIQNWKSKWRISPSQFIEKFSHSHRTFI